MTDRDETGRLCVQAIERFHGDSCVFKLAMHTRALAAENERLNGRIDELLKHCELKDDRIVLQSRRIAELAAEIAIRAERDFFYKPPPNEVGRMNPLQSYAAGWRDALRAIIND